MKMKIRVNNTMDSYVISCPDDISLKDFMNAFNKVLPHYSDNKGIEMALSDEPVDLVIGTKGRVLKTNKHASCEIG